MASDRNYGFYFFGEETELRKILSNHWDSKKGFSIDKIWSECGEYNLYEKVLSIHVPHALKMIETEDFKKFINELRDLEVSICILGGSNDEEAIYFGFKNEENSMYSFFLGMKNGFKDFYKYINLTAIGFSDWEKEILVDQSKLGEIKESGKDEESKKMDSPEWKDFLENHTSLIKEGEEWGKSVDVNDLEKDNWDG